MDKNEILANFQACTGIEDVGECLTLLESASWNLAVAASSALDGNQSNGFGGGGGGSNQMFGPAAAPTSQEIQQSTPYRRITFQCTLDGTRKEIELDESSTVGLLKQIASIEFGVTQEDGLHISRWPPAITVAEPNDSTVLAALCLPTTSHIELTKRTSTSVGAMFTGGGGSTLSSNMLPGGSLLPGVTIGGETPDDTPFEIPCSAFNTIRNNQQQQSTPTGDTVDLTRTYNVRVICTDRNNETFEFECEATKSFKELKQDLSGLTSIPTDEQQWSGFTYSTPHDETTISSMNLTCPVHTLRVQKKKQEVQQSSSGLPLAHYQMFDVPQTSSVAKKPLVSIPTMENNHSNGHNNNSFAAVISSDEDSEDDFFMGDDNEDDDDMFDVTTTAPKRNNRLMPEEVTDEQLAIHQFSTEFTSRYGEQGPTFYLGTIQQAIMEAFGGEVRRRKLLAVYVHHDQSIQANVVCSELLTKEAISSYINQHFVSWGWDVTSNYNKQKFLNLCTTHFGVTTTEALRRVGKDNYPVMILCSGRGRSCEVLQIIKGKLDLNELMAKLMNAVETANVTRLQDIQEEDARMRREQIKYEQEEAYRLSLEADQAKMIQRQEEVLREQQEAQIKENAEMIKLASIEEMKKRVPQEPDNSCNEPTCRFRFRAPDGSTFIRRFLASNKLQSLIDFIGGEGFPPPEYILLRTWPKTNLSSLDLSLSLSAHKLPSQDSLVIEQSPDYIEDDDE